MAGYAPIDWFCGRPNSFASLFMERKGVFGLVSLSLNRLRHYLTLLSLTNAIPIASPPP